MDIIEKRPLSFVFNAEAIFRQCISVLNEGFNGGQLAEHSHS